MRKLLSSLISAQTVGLPGTADFARLANRINYSYLPDHVKTGFYFVSHWYQTTYDRKTLDF
jgi:hypothetical protein